MSNDCSADVQSTLLTALQTLIDDRDRLRGEVQTELDEWYRETSIEIDESLYQVPVGLSTPTPPASTDQDSPVTTNRVSMSLGEEMFQSVWPVML